MMSSEAEDMEGQAERWYVRLQEPDCTDQEREACARWRARSPSNDAAFREVADLWRRSQALAHDPAMAELMRDARRGPRPRRNVRFRSWLPLLAALAAVFALLTIVAPSIWMKPEAPGVRYETALGERREVRLPDGTIVVLDTRSALMVRYSDGKRLVVLEAGQAQFAVEHDSERPFTVEAGGGSVTAVGTRFQVRTDAKGASVTLMEGVVVVEPPSEGAQHPAATLSPGQRLRFDRGGRWSTDRVDLEVAGAWTQGSLFVKDWRLDDLVAEMNRYSASRVRLSDPALAELRISGTFRTGDQQSLVLVLEHGWPVRASPGPEGEIVLSPTSAQRQ